MVVSCCFRAMLFHMLITSSLLLSLSWTSKDELLFLVHCIILSNPAKSGKAKTLLTLPVATALVYSFLYCQKPYSHMKYLFTKIQSNIAIWQYIAICSNTIRNMALTRIVSPLPVTMQTVEPYPPWISRIEGKLHTDLIQI